ncbi:MULTISPECIES: HK97-gp10 family putative phage morphogenesis protein [Rhizobium]|uniref:HK97-gp10 family putative phage morphogenesis protein n=1 Tax=Rhizobium TaxID=379 RepID=UPI001A92619C|nr:MULTISPECIES: HK97-gp10 family putative phage morphogenesis protein [Rhizobium]MBX4941172.1 HK97 gp10 family phage protein [Rhizobium binae]MBX5017498.1 HK97 gp10 family phage protein [Rhizobium lentis]MBX5063439.1 HK97 gp10 family phage protein [Rhizobium lentis]MBX5075545.1 HK97 gp10 family phage protein [Rhizobium lentis]MBX5213022.1 HK97 gp10 family phage protein [Rhizobium sp. NLR9a]
MAITAELKGREALMRRLNQLAPNVEKYAASAKLEAAKEVADAIQARAPRGDTLEYAESIEGDRLSSRPQQETVGTTATKDPSAAGIFAEYIWRFLEFGTAPHSTAKGGGTVLGKKLAAASGAGMHPGTAAQPHIFPTYRAMKPAIRKRIRAAVNKAVREAMGK